MKKKAEMAEKGGREEKEEKREKKIQEISLARAQNKLLARMI